MVDRTNYGEGAVSVFPCSCSSRTAGSSDAAEAPVAPHLSTSCSSSPGERLAEVPAAPCCVSEHPPGTGVLVRAASPLPSPPRRGKRGGRGGIAGLAWHSCPPDPCPCARPSAQPLRHSMGSTGEHPCSHPSDGEGQFVAGEEVYFQGVQLSNASIKHG